MVEADLLKIILVVAEGAEAQGFQETALALRKIIEDGDSLQNSCFRSIAATHNSSTLLN
ncbi:hypothetical protein [uncultured Roseobacter sp.]|uniref:hypothetical protein n=1 Tax=uncultured Roseobacter sp. TaxID=114847 RepID=UPI002621EC71|nr:hypothetical protein [uncultured Roseobacter sp.]